MSYILKRDIIIKKSRVKLILNSLITGASAVGCIYAAFTHWKNNIGQWAVAGIGLLALAGCIYHLNELLSRKIEIIISAEGIELRGDFFYSWASIEKFSTEEDDGDVTLVLKIRNQASVRFKITSLELNGEELIELLHSYGQSPGLTYAKH
jgi:hypothetical protein